MGNSAYLRYNPRDELALYCEKVIAVHVKDRVPNGGTVPLGEGDTVFAACFDMLNKK